MNTSQYIHKSYVEKIFMYKSICHNDTCMHYSTNRLIIGEYYDVYFAQYAFSDEYEIYQNGTYYTSFHVTLHNESTRESDETFLRYFYNKEQMRTFKINTIID